jgi:hypothetical protein
MDFTDDGVDSLVELVKIQREMTPRAPQRKECANSGHSSEARSERTNLNPAVGDNQGKPSA